MARGGYLQIELSWGVTNKGVAISSIRVQPYIQWAQWEVLSPPTPPLSILTPASMPGGHHVGDVRANYELLGIIYCGRIASVESMYGALDGSPQCRMSNLRIENRRPVLKVLYVSLDYLIM